MTPLETQLLRALQLRRATSFPFTPAPHGLGLPYTDEHTSSSAWARRNIAADAAVEAAIAAGEAAESGWRAHVGTGVPTRSDARVDVRFCDGREIGGKKASEWYWMLPADAQGHITHWRPAV